jgi:cell division protein FtsZ
MEGDKRLRIAEEGIIELGRHVDSLITIPNEKLLSVYGSDTSLLDAFNSANQVLQGAVQGIADLITRPGLINVDFADVRTVMSEMGMAMMGSGEASGDGRASQAAQDAISSPLLEDINLTNANGILVNVTAGKDLSIGEFQEVGEVFKEIASEDATVVLGTCIDPEMSEGIRVTVVATGLGQSPAFTHQPVRSVTALSSASSAQTNYMDLDKPTVARKRAAEDSPEVLTPGAEELLDVPAFLRRQAD